MGAVITLSKKADYILAEGSSIGVKVNGKVDKAVSIATATGTATITVANNADSELALEAVVNAVAEDVTVTLNGKEMTVNKKDDPTENTVTLKGLVDEKGKPYTVIAKAEDGSYAKILENAHGAGTDGQKTVLLSAITAKLTAAGIDYTGGIVLETGYVISETHPNWTAYSALKAAGANRSEVISGETFLPAGTEIYVEGGAGKLLTEDNKIELDGERYDDGKGLASSKYAYAYALNSDLEASTFSPLVTFKANDVALAITGKTAEVFAGDEFGPYEISGDEIVVNTGADVKLNVSVKSFKLTGGDFNGLTNNDFKIERDSDKDQLQFTLIAPKDIEKTKVAAEKYEMILDINGIEVIVNAVVGARTETADEMMAATVEALSAGVTVNGKETPDATLDNAKAGMSTAISAVVAKVGKATVNASAAGFADGYKYGNDFVKATNGTKASPAGTNGSCTVTVALTANDGTNTVTEEVDVTVTLAALTYAETDAGMTEAVAAAKSALQTAITAATGATADEVKANIEEAVASTLGENAVVVVEVGTPSENSSNSSKWDVTLTIKHKDKGTISDTLTLTGI